MWCLYDEKMCYMKMVFNVNFLKIDWIIKDEEIDIWEFFNVVIEEDMWDGLSWIFWL